MPANVKEDVEMAGEDASGSLPFLEGPGFLRLRPYFVSSNTIIGALSSTSIAPVTLALLFFASFILYKLERLSDDLLLCPCRGGPGVMETTISSVSELISLLNSATKDQTILLDGIRFKISMDELINVG